MCVRQGFTLVECIIVCALLALIVMLVATNVTFLNKFMLRSEIDKLYTVCMYTQQRAYVEGIPQSVVFDVATSTYTFENSTQQMAKQLTFGALPSVKGPPSAPTHAITKPITFNNNTIVFYPNGKIQSGTVYISDKKQSALYALTSSVEQISHLRRYCYAGTWQQIF